MYTCTCINILLDKANLAYPDDALPVDPSADME